jgi:hypothetical protein
MRRHELDSFGSGYEQVVGRCKYGNAPSISTKFREFLDYLKSYQLLDKDSPPLISLL